MKDNHTPGPWAETAPGCIDPLKGGLSICRVVKAPHDWHTMAKTKAEAEKWDRQAVANARLIAAAPDLLAALREMMPIFEAFTQDELSMTSIQEALALMPKAYGAIARATI